MSAVADYYLLKAEINGIKFITLAAKTLLAGDSAGMNTFGLCQCINELHSESKVGVPKNFVARAILESKSLNAAEELIRNTPKASGFNHVLVQGHEVRNVEIAGAKIGVSSYINQPFVHTNHYLSPALQKFENFKTINSVERYERASHLTNMGMTVKDMILLLQDHRNEENPICSHDFTLGALVFDLPKKEAYVCYGTPCKGIFNKYYL